MLRTYHSDKSSEERCLLQIPGHWKLRCWCRLLRQRIQFQMLWTNSKVYNLNSIEAQEPEMIKTSFENHFKCYLLY